MVNAFINVYGSYTSSCLMLSLCAHINARSISASTQKSLWH